MSKSSGTEPSWNRVKIYTMKMYLFRLIEPREDLDRLRSSSLFTASRGPINLLRVASRRDAGGAAARDGGGPYLHGLTWPMLIGLLIE